MDCERIFLTIQEKGENMIIMGQINQTVSQKTTENETSVIQQPDNCFWNMCETNHTDCPIFDCVNSDKISQSEFQNEADEIVIE